MPYDYDGRFVCGIAHPRYQSDHDLLVRLTEIIEAPLRLTGKVEKRARSRRYAEVECGKCGLLRDILVDNIVSFKSRKCPCQGYKYSDKKRANILGQRFDAMVQRCRRTSHVSSHNYHGRGIEARFRDREDFVRWALLKWPAEDLRLFDIDRTDNDGHYEKGNLELVTRSQNLLNRRRSCSKKSLDLT